MADIRPAVLADLPSIMTLAHEMHAESEFRVQPMSEVRAANLVAAMIQDEDGIVLVAVKDGEIIGGVVGVVCDHWFSECRVAYEHAVFLTQPERGGRTAIRIVKAFCEAAKERGALRAEMGITTGVHPERTGRLYEHCGFEILGPVYSKEL